MPLKLIRDFFKRDDGRAQLSPLYRALVAEARDTAWYLECGVPDTRDGRLEALGLMLSLMLIRLEQEGEAGKVPQVMLTELFVDDMDGQLREDGTGDVVVGKHVGKMMSALGGRLGAYKEGLDKGGLEDALDRNLFRTTKVERKTLVAAARRTRALHETLANLSLDDLLAGNIGK